MFTFSQLCRFASRFGEYSAAPCPPPLHSGWYLGAVSKWRALPRTHAPDPKMSDIAAPAPTKHCCSPSGGSPAPPRPRQWHLPGSPPSSLSLPPSHPLACACGAALARPLPARVQTCSSPRSLPAHPWVPRHPLLRARAYPGSAWRLVAVLPEGEDVCKTGLEASLYLTERPSQPYPVPLLHTSTPLSTPAPHPGLSCPSQSPPRTLPPPRAPSPPTSWHRPRPEPPLALPTPGPEPPAATSGSSSQLPRSESRRRAFNLRAHRPPPGAG